MRQRRKDIKDQEIEEAIEIDESEDVSEDTQVDSTGNEISSANKLF